MLAHETVAVPDPLLGPGVKHLLAIGIFKDPTRFAKYCEVAALDGALGVVRVARGRGDFFNGTCRSGFVVVVEVGKRVLWRRAGAGVGVVLGGKR